MLIANLIKICKYERGLVFERGVFVRMLRPGWQLLPGWIFGTRVERVSIRDPWLQHPDLDVIARSGELDGEAEVLDLDDRQRAIVTIDGRIAAVLGSGLAAVWTVFQKVEVEIFDSAEIRLERPNLVSILEAPGSVALLEQVVVAAGSRTLLFLDGHLSEVLAPGVYAFWRGVAKVEAVAFDGREQTLDVAGQELMTADRVTLRLNASLAYRVVDPAKAALEVGDAGQALYRSSQLALREVVGSRTLDALLAEKVAVSSELVEELRVAALEYGVEVRSLGIRDLILPGEMKEILNRVVEARKAAEADVIRRQQETAAMRSQANTAKIYDSNPTLMRLRELEVLETVAEKADLKVVLGESGLKDRLVQLI